MSIALCIIQSTSPAGPGKAAEPYSSHRVVLLLVQLHAWCPHRPAQDATPDDWQQLASRAAVSMFATSSLAAKPAGLYFVSVTADQIPVGAAAESASSLLPQVCQTPDCLQDMCPAAAHLPGRHPVNIQLRLQSGGSMQAAGTLIVLAAGRTCPGAVRVLDLLDFINLQRPGAAAVFPGLQHAARRGAGGTVIHRIQARRGGRRSWPQQQQQQQQPFECPTCASPGADALLHMVF